MAHALRHLQITGGQSKPVYVLVGSDTAGVGSLRAPVWESFCPALSPSRLLLDLISFGCFLKAAVSEG